MYFIGWPTQNGWVPQAQDASSSAIDEDWTIEFCMHTDDETSCRCATQPSWLGHPSF
jgi:hypothetical protein